MKAIRTTSYREIKELSDQIAGEFQPRRIILFGSHAYGKPAWDSDVDLLVVMPFKGRPNRQAVKIRSRIHTAVALDLLVRTPQHISQRLSMGDTFMHDILERAKWSMKPITREWISKAEGDWTAANLRSWQSR